MRPILLLTTLAAAKDLQKLIKQMTLDEKLALLHGSTSNYTGATTAIARLGVPRLLLNDGPQGFRTPTDLEGTSTAFPSGLAVAATFDDALAATWASTIASEFAKKGATVLLGPGLNVARVPVNGRNFEYCSGEDPYLGARMAASIIPAIQSQHVIATAKHYVLNNQETGRIGADSVIDERTWREIYLPPFESAVAHGALAAMCSYNRVTLNNVTAWACEHPLTLHYLKKQSSLFVMSDWLATHSTQAIVEGLDQEMPGDFYFGSKLRKDVQSGAIDEATIDAASLNVLRAMQTIGALDRAPRGDLTADVSTPANRDIARRVAAHAIVLLKNDGLLPLKSCAGLVVLGDLANYTVGGGSGRVVGRTVSLKDAFETRCGFVEAYADLQSKAARDAVATATNVLVVTGSQSTEGADRATLALDGEAMIEAASTLNPSIIVACAAPGAFLTGWRDSVQAILTTWPGGQELANALVDVLFGDVNPTGRLPLTLPMTANDLKFTQRMYPGLPDPTPPKGCADPCLRVYYDEKLEVGYRRYDSRNIEPAYAFGHGRSYTSFVYGNLTVSRHMVAFDVRNTGATKGAEVAQLYVVPPNSGGYQQLKGFHKTKVLAPGGVERVTLRFDARTFSAFLDGAWRRVPGAHELRVGASSRDARLRGTVDV